MRDFHQPALTCDAPLPAVHHTMNITAEKRVTGTQLVLRCQEGYTPVGDLTFQCLPNQQWSTVKGHCKSMKTNSHVILVFGGANMQFHVVFTGVHCSRPLVKGTTSMAVISGSGTVATGGQFHFGDRILISCQHGTLFFCFSFDQIVFNLSLN